MSLQVFVVSLKPGSISTLQGSGLMFLMASIEVKSSTPGLGIKTGCYASSLYAIKNQLKAPKAHSPYLEHFLPFLPWFFMA